MELGSRIKEHADVVTGWRAWVVTATGEGLRLASVLHEVVWPAGRPVIAECRRHEDPFADVVPLHPVPSALCSCGFHAARDVADALSYARGRDEPGTVCRVLGEVTLWGHVVETECGWRASHAYPARLYVPDREIAAALAAYRVTISCAECESPSSPTCTAMLSPSALLSQTSRSTAAPI
jgi:hypothetical protein